MTVLRNRDHCRSLGEGLWMMYQAGYLLDIEVHLHGKTTRAHRLVLAALSPVLRPSLVPLTASVDCGVALDLSSAVDDHVPLRSINLDDVVDEPLDLDLLLEFVYRGEVTLSDRAGLPSLLRTAEVLKIECLVEPEVDGVQIPSGDVEQITITVEQPLIASYSADSNMSCSAVLGSEAPSSAVSSATALLMGQRSVENADNGSAPAPTVRKRRKYTKRDISKAKDRREDVDGEDDDDTAPSFWCPHCCELFSDPIVYAEHMSKQHPSTASADEQISSTSARTRNKRRSCVRVNYREVSEKTGKGRGKAKSKKSAEVAASNKDESNENCEYKSNMESLDQVRLSCPLCDFWTAHSWRLTKHLAAIHKVYENGRPQAKEQCQFCDYTCVTAALLKRHVKCKHSTNRPYKCLECDFSAAIRSDLDRHKTAKHCTERRFQCSLCGYKSKTKNAHDRHSKTHAKTILTCKTCGLWYTSDGYRRHVKSHVVTDNDGLNSSVIVKCHLCDQLMSISDTTESSMRMHLMDVHAVDVDKKNAQIERCNRAKMIPSFQSIELDQQLAEHEFFNQVVKNQVE